MFANTSANRADFPVDVELPLSGPQAVDLDLSMAGAVSAGLSRDMQAAFQPSLSQVAADPSHLRLRWPVGSRPGYHGNSGGNWMHNSRAGFAGRTIGGA